MYRKSHIASCCSLIFEDTIKKIFSKQISFLYQANYNADSKLIISLSQSIQHILTASLKSYFYTQRQISNILITKILLGIFGITPAFDKYVRRSLKKLAEIGNTYNITELKPLSDTWSQNSYLSIQSLLQTPCVKNFFISNRAHFYSIKKPYPMMRCLDIALWLYGQTLPSSKKKEQINQ